MSTEKEDSKVENETLTKDSVEDVEADFTLDEYKNDDESEIEKNKKTDRSRE